MDFRWDDLGLVVAVHRGGTLAAAAAALNIDASTASRRLRAIEQALGGPLFDRTPDGLVPTELVRRVLPHAEAAAAAARSVAAVAAGHETTPTGIVRLAIADAFAAYVVAPRVADFLDAHPGLRLDLLVSTDVVDLTRFEAEVAVRFVRPTHGDLVYQRVASTGTYGAFVHRRYLERYGTPPHPPLHWLGWSDRKSHIPEARAFAEFVGVPPRLAADDMVVLMEAWRAGVGALLLPVALVALGERDAIILDEPRPTSFSVDVFLVTHRSLRDVPRVRAVRNWLVELLEDLDQRAFPK